jgi:hypothetical protein
VHVEVSVRYLYEHVVLESSNAVNDCLTSKCCEVLCFLSCLCVCWRAVKPSCKFTAGTIDANYKLTNSIDALLADARPQIAQWVADEAKFAMPDALRDEIVGDTTRRR